MAPKSLQIVALPIFLFSLNQNIGTQLFWWFWPCDFGILRGIICKIPNLLKICKSSSLANAHCTYPDKTRVNQLEDQKGLREANTISSFAKPSQKNGKAS